MQRALVLLVVLAWAGFASAGEPTQEERMESIRRAFEKSDYPTVRAELLAAYEAKPDPQLLFALGQVELNLGNYQAAIDYYEKFIASSPTAEEIGVAQQAIGAARMRLASPPPPSAPPPPPVVVLKPAPPPRVPPREWRGADTAFVVLGTASILGGAGLVYYSYDLGTDRSGTLADYHDRVERSHTARWAGIGVAGVGTLAIGLALVRWRMRPDGPSLSARLGTGTTTFALTSAW